MSERDTPIDGGLVQQALELRHDVEELTVRCRGMYEEANALVERLRQLQALAPPEGQAGTPPDVQAGAPTDGPGI